MHPLSVITKSHPDRNHPSKHNHYFFSCYSCHESTKTDDIQFYDDQRDCPQKNEQTDEYDDGGAIWENP